jgi:hypothetical protein
MNEHDGYYDPEYGYMTEEEFNMAAEAGCFDDPGYRRCNCEDYPCCGCDG